MRFHCILHIWLVCLEHGWSLNWLCLFIWWSGNTTGKCTSSSATDNGQAKCYNYISLNTICLWMRQRGFPEKGRARPPSRACCGGGGSQLETSFPPHLSPLCGYHASSPSHIYAIEASNYWVFTLVSNQTQIHTHGTVGVNPVTLKPACDYMRGLNEICLVNLQFINKLLCRDSTASKL